MGMYGEACPKPAFAKYKRQAARDKLKAWHAVRKAVLARDAGTCRACRTKAGVDVHHLRFRSMGGDDTSRNLACLCRVCHAAVHAYRLALEGDADKRLKVTWL